MTTLFHILGSLYLKISVEPKPLSLYLPFQILLVQYNLYSWLLTWFIPKEANDVEEILHIFLWCTILISIYATRKGQAGFKSPTVEFMSKWGLTAISPKRDFYNTTVLQTESEEEWEWDERLLSSQIRPHPPALFNPQPADDKQRDEQWTRMWLRYSGQAAEISVSGSRRRKDNNL